MTTMLARMPKTSWARMVVVVVMMMMAMTDRQD